MECCCSLTCRCAAKTSQRSSASENKEFWEVLAAPGTSSYLYKYMQVYACMYIHMFMYMFVCIHIHIYIFIHLFIYVHVYTYLCICTYIHTYIHTYITDVYICIYTRTYIHPPQGHNPGASLKRLLAAALQRLPSLPEPPKVEDEVCRVAVLRITTSSLDKHVTCTHT